ncbi:MAG TPA: hypothetical protein VIX86_06755 [Streptosporangiaceae bacterium]
MAAVTAGRPRRSLLGLVADALTRRARAKGRVSRVASLVSDHAMTVAAMAAIDTGMFHLGAVAGWCAVGVSLLIIDLKLD